MCLLIVFCLQCVNYLDQLVRKHAYVVLKTLFNCCRYPRSSVKYLFFFFLAMCLFPPIGFYFVCHTQINFLRIMFFCVFFRKSTSLLTCVCVFFISVAHFFYNILLKTLCNGVKKINFFYLLLILFGA